VDKENILQELEAEREEVSALQGTVRELEWLLMHSEVENKNKLDFVRKKEGMVKVHSSHLEEVDQYIMDLRSKLEESETKRKGAEVALAVQDLKRAASLDAATLVQVPNKHDGRPLAYSLSLDNRNDSLCVRTRASFDAGVRSGHFSVPGVQDNCWELGNPSGRLGFLAASWCCANPSMESSLTFILHRVFFASCYFVPNVIGMLQDFRFCKNGFKLTVLKSLLSTERHHYERH
jgi:hypothetical protein